MNAARLTPAWLPWLAVQVALSACGPGPRSDPGLAREEGVEARDAEPASTEMAEELPAARGPDFLAIRYRAIGTEPFWGIEITADSLVFEQPDADPVHFRVTKLRRWAGTDVLSGAAGDRSIEVTIERHACSDGMSDRRYAFQARVDLGDRRLNGCAFERPLESAPRRARTVDRVARAGLTAAVREARDIRGRQSEFERQVGSLDTDDATRAMFAAHFEGDDVRMIEFRRYRDEEVLRETTYYFAGRGGETPAPSLIDGVMRNGSDETTTWFLLGFDAAGTPAGQMVEVDGTPADPPAGLAAEELRRARDLIAAARRARG